MADAHSHGIEVRSASPEWVSIRVPCDLANVDAALEMLEPRGSHLDHKTHDELCTAVREMLMNAIEHGGGNDPSKFVQLDCIVTPQQILVEITDPGPGFRRADLKHAAVGNPANGSQLEHLEVRQAQGIRPGGFGLMMAQQMVDHLIYNERGNQVLLIKSLRHP
ncbi:MAG: ATP-binding protein [Bryobacteraceae bacterium]|nr:ATP-binding protein [Bryobacteraceae bacterium]